MLRLPPRSDLADLSARYARDGRIQLADFLEEADAEQVRGWLLALPWLTAYNEGATVHRPPRDQLARLPRDELTRIMAGIGERARTRFQFIYDYWPIFVRYFTPGHPRLPVFAAYEFLNSPEVLDQLRAVTGLSDIRWADAQATWFRPGHFLKPHDDINEVEQRRAAYVLSFARDWQRDWGGFLQFFDPDGNVELGIKPAFNTLNIFTVPADHSVEMVATYAAGERLSITGWLRADPPPRRP